MLTDATTLRRMSAFLVALAKGESVTERTQIEQMADLVDKYRHFDIPAALSPKATSPASASVVLLSGATGSLGANQLAQLLSRSEVEKVYALVRAKDDDEAALRVKTSLEEKGLAGASDSRIVALAADFSQDRLGLSESRFKEVKSDVTVVLHVRSPSSTPPHCARPGPDARHHHLAVRLERQLQPVDRLVRAAHPRRLQPHPALPLVAPTRRLLLRLVGLGSRGVLGRVGRARGRDGRPALGAGHGLRPQQVGDREAVPDRERDDAGACRRAASRADGRLDRRRALERGASRSSPSSSCSSFH